MKFLKIGIGLLLLWNVSYGQNTPNLSETGPSGVISNPILNKPVPYTVPQTPALNFSRTWIPQKPLFDANQLNENTPPENTTQSTSYTDGLGNGTEQIVRFGISTQYHSVSFADPRSNGIEKYEFLPYALHFSQGTGFRYNMIAEQETYYTTKFPNEDNTAYSLKKLTYDVSGNRTIKTMSPGKSQVGQYRGTVTSAYLQNTPGSTKKWELDANGFPFTNGSYGISELMYAMTTGEHGMEVRKYSDKEGKEVATKVVSGVNVTEVSYTIYDDHNRPVIILTPKAVQKIESNGWVVTQNILDNLCSKIEYDDLGRVTSKTVPGKEGLEKIVYDKWQRPVLSQDPNLALQNQWLFSLYDEMGRVVITGKLTSLENQGWWQYLLDGTGAVPGNAMPTIIEQGDLGKIYTYLLNGLKNIQGGQNYPVSILDAEILRYNFYDTYNHADLIGFAFDQNYLNDLYPDAYTIAYAEEPELRTMPVRGFMTGYKEKIIKDVGSNTNLGDWVFGAIYYNNEGQAIQTQRRVDKKITGAQISNNFLDINTTMFDFKGRIVRSVLYHEDKSVSGTPGNYTYTNETTTIAQKYQYESKTFKLNAVRQKIDNQDWMNLSILNYNTSTGLVNSKSIGGVENQTYAYNIRGQLTGINANYAETGVTVPNVTFGESIKYDYGFANKRFDGAISGIIWKTPSTKRRAYGYTYSEAGRLAEADFRQLEASDQLINADWKKTNIDLSEKGITYDFNGNITHLKRQGPTNMANFDMDDLDYTYDNSDVSNRLLKVTDAIAYTPNATQLIQDFQNGGSGVNNDFTYDHSGNLISDNNKDISSVSYSYLNKPAKVTFVDGTNIEYIYTAGGEKLEETTSPIGGTPDKTTYIGVAIYKNDILDNLLHSEGKARKVVSAANVVTYEYDFFVKDHLGNVRTQVTAEEVPFSEYFATHELAYANMENLIFDNMELVNAPRPGASNYDNTKSAKLDASDPDKRIGTALLMHVMAGDKFSLSAEAFYNGDTTGLHGTVSPADMLSSISSVLLKNQGGGSTGEGLPIPEVINGAFSSANYLDAYQDILDNLTDPNHPQSYLNYLVFDEEMNLVPSQSGAIQIGASGGWHTLETLNEIEITQGGYLSVYISNASLETHTYYDNILITYYKGNLREETHYYPYGMALQISPALPTDNKYLYQTKELTRKAGNNDYNIYNFEARQYDPLLGRFTSIDAMGQFASGYVGMGNNPVTGIDPDGNWRTDVQNYGILMGYHIDRLMIKAEKSAWDAMLAKDFTSKDGQMGALCKNLAITNNTTLDDADLAFRQSFRNMEALFNNSAKATLRKLLPSDANLENITTGDMAHMIEYLQSDGATITVLGEGKEGKIFFNKKDMESYIIEISETKLIEAAAQEYTNDGVKVYYASPYDKNTAHTSENLHAKLYSDEGWEYTAEFHTHPGINDSYSIYGEYIPTSMFNHEGGSLDDQVYSNTYHVPVYAYELKTNNLWLIYSDNGFDSENKRMIMPALFLDVRGQLSRVYGRIIGQFR